MRRLSLAAGLLLVAAGCGAGVPAVVDGEGRKLREQSFSPPYPAQMPGGRTSWIARANLNQARDVLTVEFTGGKGYLESDLCSTDYTAWVGGTADRLEVLVVEVAHIRLGSAACTAEGYRWTFHLGLPEPYAGTEVIDRAENGGVLLVGPPADAATLKLLPDGWVLASSDQQCCGGNPPIWMQIYAREGDEVGLPPTGPGRLVLYQAFGLTPEWLETGALKFEGRGGRQEPATFHGGPAKVWVDPEGEMLFAWDSGGRSYGLIGNQADMTVDELVEYAASLAVPPS